MVGACTPAAALTARVDTASRPPWASSSAAAARMRSRGRSAVRSTTFMLMMITEFCYHLIVSDANIKTVINDTARWRAILIIVTGANGQLGRAIVEQLLGRIPAEQIGVSVRDPEKAQGRAEQGVRVRRGDFADAASLAHAFEGRRRYSSCHPAPPAGRRSASIAPRSTQPRRPDSLHQPHGREPVLALPSDGRPRRH